MMALIRRMFGPPIRAITLEDVQPAKGDPARDDRLRAAQAELAKALVKHDRRSYEVRQELAGNVLSIVSGNR